MVNEIGKLVLSFLNRISNNRLGSDILYIARTHQIPNYKNPRNFNDKTMNLKFSYKDNELVIKCTDKYEVRQYIEKIECEEILNEIYGVYESVDEIDFDKLPDKFVLKCTHGCAYNIICFDKKILDIEATKRKLNKWLKETYGWATGELHYTKIKPRIICEKFIETENNELPVDYKFYCFNGICKGILVCSERIKKLKLNFFNSNWQELKYIKDYERGSTDIKKPDNLKEMIKYAEKLSKDFKFVRVDLYSNEDKIVFGELTFTPACCCAPYYSKLGNEELGKLL